MPLSLNFGNGLSGVIQLTSLSASVAKDATSFTTNDNLPSFLGSRAAVLAIDYGQNICDVCVVTSVSGATVNVATALTNAHSSGAKVAWLADARVRPILWGALHDGSTDDSMAWQAAALQASRLGLIVDGGDAAQPPGVGYSIAQPIFLPQLDLRSFYWVGTSSGVDKDSSRSFVTGQDYSTYTARSARQWSRVTAVASTDTFTIDANQNNNGGAAPANAKAISINAPMGASLPGGISSWHTYYVVNRTASTFQVSLSPGGSVVDVTADGSAWCWFNWDSLSRLHIEQARIDVSTQDLGGIYMDIQQPSAIKDLRVLMNAAASVADNAIGIYVFGQIANLSNIEPDPESLNTVGMAVVGTLFTFSGKTMCQAGGAAKAAVAVIIGASNGCKFDGFEFEGNYGTPIRLVSTPQSLSLGDLFVGNDNGPAAFIDDQTSGNSDYEVGFIQAGNTSQVLVKDNNAGGRGYTLNSYTGSQYALAVGNPGALNYSGHHQGPGTQSGPNFKDRYTIIFAAHNQTTATVHPDCDYVLNPDTADITLTLHSVTGMSGVQHRFVNEPGNAHNIVVAPNGAEKINGANSSVSVAGGHSLTLQGSGDGWFTVAST